MEELKHFALEAVAMIASVRQKLSIDWHIPATWIIGIALATMGNLGLLLWRGGQISTQLDYMQAADRSLAENSAADREKRIAVETKMGRIEQHLQDLNAHLEVHARRLERMEEERIRAPRR